MSAQRTIKSYVLHKYGLNISAETPEFDQNAKRWVAGIRSNYPVYVQDDRNPSDVALHFIPIRNIGKITFDEKLFPVKEESTPREKCLENVQSLLKSYYDRTERIIVQASANNLVMIPEFRHFFTPIDQIITALLEKDQVSFVDLLRHRTPRNQTKIRQYLKLLESMEIIESKNDHIETGRMFWLLHEGRKNKEEEPKPPFDEETFRKAIISEFLKTRYTALTQVFEISRVQPSIHVDSCVYRPALEAEEVVCLSTKSIFGSYTSTYGRINEINLANYLRRLRMAGAVERDGQYWCGTKPLVDEMVKLKNEMPELSPPLMP